MLSKTRVLFVAGICALAFCQPAMGQAPATILEIEVENFVTYFNDVTDYTRLAMDANRTSIAVQARNFAQSVGVADIVSVNGKPAKGVLTERRVHFNRQITPTAPGQAIADSVRDTIMDRYFEILKPDGTPIGTIMTSGVGGGTPAPGAPALILGADFTVTGGTGAFLGARGQAGGTRDNRPGPRAASVTEDPGNRRTHGGGLRRFVVQLVPLTRPEIIQTAGGPAVVHSSDFSLVTAARPARPGEILSLFASGLGPTRPGVDPGRPFTTTPLHNVNSPVEVTVNGTAAEVLYSGGYPGSTDTYQVNFRLPSGISAGQAALQITVAWIAGTESRIPVAAQ